MRYIDDDLNIDDYGFIKVYNNIDDINIRKLKLFFRFNKGEIVCSDFGNNLYSIVLQDKSELLIKTVINELLEKIESFGVVVDESYYVLNDDSIDIIFVVRGEEIKIKGKLSI